MAALRRGGGRRRLADAGARRGTGQRRRCRRSAPSRRTRSCVDGGCATAKVKVAEPGQTLADDQARVEAVRDALGPVGPGAGRRQRRLVGRRRRRRDRACSTGPPAGWSTSSSRARPSRSWPPYAGAVDVPIAADESIRRAADPYRVRDLEAADIAVLKVQPLGGVRACLRIAEDIGLPGRGVVRAGDLGRDRGRARPGRRRCPSCPTRAGSRPCSCSPRDVVAEPLLPVDGVLPVRRARPSTRTRSTCSRPTADRVAHWEARLAEVAVRQVDARERRPSSARAVVARAGRGRRPRGRARARARATRRSPSRRTTPPRPGCSGCTPGSTSAPPASSPSG